MALRALRALPLLLAGLGVVCAEESAGPAVPGSPRRRYSEATLASDYSRTMDHVLRRNFVEWLLARRERKRHDSAELLRREAQTPKGAGEGQKSHLGIAGARELLGWPGKNREQQSFPALEGSEGLREFLEQEFLAWLMSGELCRATSHGPRPFPPTSRLTAASPNQRAPTLLNPPITARAPRPAPPAIPGCGEAGFPRGSANGEGGRGRARAAAANGRGGRRRGHGQGDAAHRAAAAAGPSGPRADPARCRLPWLSSAPQRCSAAAPGPWPGPCPWLCSAGLRRARRCLWPRSPGGSSAAPRCPGTSTRPPSSSGPAPPPWAWRARGRGSAPCSGASSSATPGTRR